MKIRSSTSKNLLSLKGEDISAKLALYCFTQEQRDILSFKQGEIDIDIEDQINHFYGERLLTWDEASTIRKFSYLVHEYSYIIDDIGRLKEYITALKNVDNYTDYEDVKNRFNNTSASVVNLQDSNRTVNIRDGFLDNESIAFRRQLSSQPVKLIERAKVGNDQKDLILSYVDWSYRSFNRSDNDRDRLLITEIEKRANKPIMESEDEVDYHNMIIDREGSRNRTVTQDNNEVRSLNDSDTKSKAVMCGLNISNKESGNRAKSIEDMINKEIPRLRTMFWNKFSNLFANIDPCFWE